MISLICKIIVFLAVAFIIGGIVELIISKFKSGRHGP